MGHRDAALESIGTVSFDRAAGYYDATRGLPADVQESLTDVLAGELAGKGPCLEVGVGTGRIALALHRRGVPLVGADVAPAMLARLAGNAGGRAPFPLVLADTTRLPFRTGCFGAVLFSHVLHLVADWRSALEEAFRVLAPDGAVLVDFGGPVESPWTGPSRELMHGHGIDHVRPGVTDPDVAAAYLGGRAGARKLPAVTMEPEWSLAQDLVEWEGQLHAWTWPYQRETMLAACADIRAWAQSEGWPLDRKVRLRRVLQWWAYEPTFGLG